MKSHIAIAGAGFSGAVLARQLAETGSHRVVVFDERPHIAGNCHTERDASTGVMLHTYGPHIFNTDREDVWRYVQGFGEFMPFLNRVKAITTRGVFPLPINLLTLNLFFNKTLNPAQARAFLALLGDATIGEPANFEEQALNDNYYNTRYQGIPKEGYTSIVKSILDHPAIEVRLGESLSRTARGEFRHLFFSGPLDAYFEYALGRLRYRTVYFKRFEGEGDLQGNPVINYPGEEIPFTRIHEHKHFAPWEQHERSVAFEEYSKATGATDTPFYPVRLMDDKKMFSAYLNLAREEQGVSFLGRLGTYRYMNMDQVIAEALDFSREVLEAWAGHRPPPSFPSKAGHLG
jgi:UDP-galactopyranose mutase